MVDIIENEEQSDTIKKQIDKAKKLKDINDEVSSQFDRALYFKYGNDLYVWIDIDGHKEVMKVHGGKLTGTFGNYFKHRMMSIGLDNDEIKDRLDRLVGNFLVNAKKFELGTRVMSEGGNSNIIWYDLSNDKWEYIKTVPSEDGSGWSLEKNTPYPMFYRWEHQISQVYPEKVSIEEAKELIQKLFYDKNTGKGILRLKDDDNKILKIVSMITKFIPNIERTIDLTVAPAGYTKSYGDKILKLIVDPSKVIAFRRPAKYSQEVVQNVSHHWLYCIDNCNDELSIGISDLLSTVVTGAYDSQRQLYSTDKDFIRNLSYHCITINGIFNPITRPDLIERTILYELDTTEEERRDTEDLDKEFDEIRPKLIGSIFTILSKAMQLKQNTKFPPIRYRMVNFIKWGYCIAEAVGIGGNRFMDIYTSKVRNASQDIVNENSVAKVINYMILGKGTNYIGDMTGLWVLLYSGNKEAENKKNTLPLGNERDELTFSNTDKSVADQYIQKTGDYSILSDKPKSPDSLGKRISAIENDLKKSGILIRRGIVWKGNKVEREIEIKNKE